MCMKWGEEREWKGEKKEKKTLGKKDELSVGILATKELSFVLHCSNSQGGTSVTADLPSAQTDDPDAVHSEDNTETYDKASSTEKAIRVNGMKGPRKKE